VSEVARELFDGVMAPLVLGGDVRPSHAIGARAALALETGAGAVDPSRYERVQHGRVRQARRLLPIDEVGPPTAAEWAIGAALHDVMHAANPTFEGALRRSMAAKILDLAMVTLDRVPAPATVAEALSRHTWFARTMDVARTDTTVSWWSGSRVFRGVDPPARLQAWPGVRRVTVAPKAVPLLEVGPLAVRREQLTLAVARLLDRSPLTALATCTRAAPPFAWSGGTLALVAGSAGRTIVLRALERLPSAEVDAALGRATRDLLDRRREIAAPALALLADRAIAAAEGRVVAGGSTAGTSHATAARAIGAVVAVSQFRSGDAGWGDAERERLIDALGAVVQTEAGVAARGLVEGPS
jgi:hypothetical protein